jgi:hypothetical protein
MGWNRENGGGGKWGRASPELGGILAGGAGGGRGREEAVGDCRSWWWLGRGRWTGRLEWISPQAQHICLPRVGSIFGRPALLSPTLDFIGRANQNPARDYRR